MINVVFKNMEGLFSVLQCTKCKKLVFVKHKPSRWEKFICCECGVELKLIELETGRVEIEL